MIDVVEKKEKIISFLKNHGPSIPVRISKEINMDPVFASAILSELFNEKKVKTSHMKLGSSPFYLIPGQESRLEDYADKLKSVEKEAYDKLKSKEYLLDSEQPPAIRVALRSLKDFATSFTHEEKLYWRYVFSSEEEVLSKLVKPLESHLNQTPTPTPIMENPPQEKTPPAQIESQKKEERPEKKPKKQEKLEPIFEETEEDSDLSSLVKEYVKKKNIELIDTIQSDKKELVAKVRVPTALGTLDFLLIAKNKKAITKDEINSALQRSKYHLMPCLYLIRKEPPKSLRAELESNNLLRLDII